MLTFLAYAVGHGVQALAYAWNLTPEVDFSSFAMRGLAPPGGETAAFAIPTIAPRGPLVHPATARRARELAKSRFGLDSTAFASERDEALALWFLIYRDVIARIVSPQTAVFLGLASMCRNLTIVLWPSVILVCLGLGPRFGPAAIPISFVLLCLTAELYRALAQARTRFQRSYVIWTIESFVAAETPSQGSKAGGKAAE